LSEGSRKNKPLHEHIASILPFRVLEATEGKPLRIAGVAMTAGMSRNNNVYTPEELQAFAPKLIGSPLYLEHVTVNNAIGKVTNCVFDAQTKSLLYEAEINDSAIAEKIRNGLIQHVSVGADYDTLDSANVPHGLHNAEMSLVAVPGIPETNIQVLESLLHKATENLEPEIPGEYFLGFVQNSNLFLPEHFRAAWLDQVNGVLALMGKTRADPAVERCHEILFLKSKWQPNTVADWLKLHPDYAMSAGSNVQINGVEQMEKEELEVKLSETEAKLATAESKLAETNNRIENLKQLVPGVDLLVNPPKLMPVSECLQRLGRLELPKMQERLSLGNQLQAQKVRKEIFEVKQKYGVA
jgi:hypothetical protein